MDKTMQTDIFKDFAQRLRKFTLQDVYIIVIDEDVTEQLKKYMRLLCDIKLEADCYNAYYGAMKKILASFISYYSYAIDRVIVGTDKYMNVVNRDELFSLVEKTIGIHVDQQISFGKDYLPVQSATERQNYDEIQTMYDDFMQKFCELRQRVEKLDKQDKVDDFAQEHFKFALEKTSEIFKFAHIYIALMLTDRLKEIRISLEEILLRLNNNLRQIQEECEQTTNTLMHNLYDQNKELMAVSRQYRNDSVEIAEIHRSIEKTREQLDAYKYEASQSRVEEEVEFWRNRLHEFNEVAEPLTKLKTEHENLEKQRALYASRTCTELPGSKADCWIQMGKNLDERSELLREKIIEVGKALITFFAVRGSDRVYYESDLGMYIVDEFDHQVYVKDFDLENYHVSCKGEFSQAKDTQKYFFDEFGRYIKDENGEKTYQIGVCTSQYKLDEDEVFRKITKDCGHSEAVNRKCKMRIKDPNDVEVLPDFEPADIKNSLDPEVVKYLWDSFGHILPNALRDVSRYHSKNPIHHLAHKLLHYKHEKTRAELDKSKKEANDFRLNIYKERQDKAAAESKAWKEKQVKRRKPEESDDMVERAVYDAKMAEQDFITSLNYFYS